VSYSTRKRAINALQKLGHDLQPISHKDLYYEHCYTCSGCLQQFGVNWEGTIWLVDIRRGVDKRQLYWKHEIAQGPDCPNLMIREIIQ